VPEQWLARVNSLTKLRSSNLVLVFFWGEEGYGELMAQRIEDGPGGGAKFLFLFLFVVEVPPPSACRETTVARVATGIFCSIPLGQSIHGLEEATD